MVYHSKLTINELRDIGTPVSTLFLTNDITDIVPTISTSDLPVEVDPSLSQELGYLSAGTPDLVTFAGNSEIDVEYNTDLAQDVPVPSDPTQILHMLSGTTAVIDIWSYEDAFCLKQTGSTVEKSVVVGESPLSEGIYGLYYYNDDEELTQIGTLTYSINALFAAYSFPVTGYDLYVYWDAWNVPSLQKFEFNFVNEDSTHINVMDESLLVARITFEENTEPSEEGYYIMLSPRSTTYTIDSYITSVTASFPADYISYTSPYDNLRHNGTPVSTLVATERLSEVPAPQFKQFAISVVGSEAYMGYLSPADSNECSFMMLQAFFEQGSTFIFDGEPYPAISDDLTELYAYSVPQGTVIDVDLILDGNHYDIASLISLGESPYILNLTHLAPTGDTWSVMGELTGTVPEEGVTISLDIGSILALGVAGSLGVYDTPEQPSGFQLTGPFEAVPGANIFSLNL